MNSTITSTQAVGTSATVFASLIENFENDIREGHHSLQGNYQRSVRATRIITLGAVILPTITERLEGIRDTSGFAANQVKEAWIMLLKDLAQRAALPGIPRGSSNFSEWLDWAKKVSN